MTRAESRTYFVPASTSGQPFADAPTFTALAAAVVLAQT